MPETREFTYKDQPYRVTHISGPEGRTLSWKMKLPDGHYYGDGFKLPESPDEKAWEIEKMWEILTISAQNFIDRRQAGLSADR